MTIHDLLLQYYLDWQRQRGEIGTWKQFSEEIGVEYVYLNKIFNGKRRVGEKIVQTLADYFKDQRFYDAADIERPDPLLAYTRRNWGSVPDELKQRIADEIAQYTSEPLPNGGETETAKS